MPTPTKRKKKNVKQLQKLLSKKSTIDLKSTTGADQQHESPKKTNDESTTDLKSSTPDSDQPQESPMKTNDQLQTPDHLEKLFGACNNTSITPLVRKKLCSYFTDQINRCASTQVGMKSNTLKRPRQSDAAYHRNKREVETLTQMKEVTER